MKINKTKLQEALSIVKPGLADKEVLEQTTSFAFNNGRVMTYNDELSISHPVDGLSFTGTVEAAELYGLLQRLQKEEISVAISESELRVSCGRVKAGLTLTEQILLPIEEEIGQIKKWGIIPNPELFAKHLSFGMNTCTSDMSRLKLTCVHITQEGLIQASDGFRLLQCTGDPLPTPPFLLSASLIKEVIKIKPTHMSLVKSWVHFKNAEGTILSARIINESYIPQEKIDEILRNKGLILSFPAEIRDILDRVGQFAKRDFSFDEKVEISIKENVVTLSAEADKTKSWIRESAPIESELEISFAMTPDLFRDILKETKKCTLAKDLKKASFISKAGSWKYVIMLRG